MELRFYLAVLNRRLWIPIAVTLIALLASAAGMVLIPQALSYQATVRLAVKPAAEPRNPLYYTYDEYYAYLASEYLNDDVIELVQGQLFLDEVRRLSPEAPAGSIRGKKAHRVLSLTVTAGTAEGALALARGATDLLVDPKGASERYFDQLTAQRPTVTVIDPPAITSAPGTRSIADLLLRGALGLIVGVGLAFLIDYLDDTLRDSADAEQALGLSVLGEIPKPTSPPRPSGRSPSPLRGEGGRR